MLVPNAQLQTSPGLGLPLGYVFAAVPVGAALIMLPMIRNIYRRAEEPMAETLLIVFIVFILLGMPISIALGVGALGAAMLYPALNPIIIPTRFVGLLSDSYLLLSAPLFILAGNIAARGGVARVLIDLATALVGRFRGGLAYVNVVDSMFFGGISGSAVADVSALGTFLIPQMVRKGYDLDFATALTISTAVVAPIIPPSIIAVIYAWMAEESVAAMFAAGILPGHPGRARDGGPGVRHCQEAQLSKGAAADAAPSSCACSAQGAAGAGDPRDHHGRHPVRLVHAHRSRRGGGGLRARGAADLLSRAGLARAAEDLRRTRPACRA